MPDYKCINFLDINAIDDKAYELGAVVPIRIRNIALSLYVDSLKSGKRIPPPLQDYINRGLQRIVDGENPPFPVIKADKLNKVAIASCVKEMIDRYGKTKAMAIKDTALYFKVTTKTVMNIYRKDIPTSSEYYVYYLIDAISEIVRHQNN